MKKFSFPLQKVLEYKAHVEKREMDTLRTMQHEHQKLCDKLSDLERKYEEYKREYIERSREGISASDLTKIGTYLNEFQKQMQSLRKKIEQSAAQIDLQIEKLLAVKKDKTSMEKLREKHVAAYQAVERKEDELFIDEFIANVTTE